MKIDTTLSLLAMAIYFYVWYSEYKAVVQSVIDTKFEEEIEIEDLEEQIGGKDNELDEEAKAEKERVQNMELLNTRLIRIYLVFAFAMALVVILLILIKKAVKVLNGKVEHDANEFDFTALLTVFSILAVGTKVCMSFDEFYIDVFVEKESLSHKEYVITQVKTLFYANLVMMIVTYLLFCIFQAVL